HPYLSLEWIAERLGGSVTEGYLGKKSVLATISGASTEVRLNALENDVTVHCAKKELQAEVGAEVSRLLELEPKTEPKAANDNQAETKQTPPPLPAMSADPFAPDSAGGIVGRLAAWITSTAIVPLPELSLVSSVALWCGLFGDKALTPMNGGIHVY